MNLLVRLLYVLAAIVVVVICYLVTVYVLALAGLAVPYDLLKAVFVLLGILAVIGALTGRYDAWVRLP